MSLSRLTAETRRHFRGLLFVTRTGPSSGRDGGRRNAGPHLRDLVRTTGESTSISQLDGSDIVYVARVEVPKIIALRVEVGTRFPAAVCPQGTVLLAALDPADVPGVLAIPSRSGIVPHRAYRPAEVEPMLREVRARGWAPADDALAR